MLKVIGLGARDRDISLRGMQALEGSDHVFLKTNKVEGAQHLKAAYPSFDALYDSSETFDELNERIVSELIEKTGTVCYLVPYSPYQDTSVQLLQERAKIEIFDCAGHALPLAANGVFLSCYQLPCVDTFCYDKSLPLYIYDIDSFAMASAAKLFLGEIVGDECNCIMNGKELSVYEIDRLKKYDYRSAVQVQPQELAKRKAFSYYDLIEILLRLRRPDGCQWDRAQTHETLKKCLVEETQELVEAIDKKDIFNMQEECGDVLLQPVFHAAIANELNEFSYRDMMKTLCEKLIFRHSHVFGDDTAGTQEEALLIWKRNKQREKDGKGN